MTCYFWDNVYHLTSVNQVSDDAFFQRPVLRGYFQAIVNNFNNLISLINRMKFIVFQKLFQKLKFLWKKLLCLIIEPLKLEIFISHMRAKTFYLICDLKTLNSEWWQWFANEDLYTCKLNLTNYVIAHVMCASV